MSKHSSHLIGGLSPSLMIAVGLLVIVMFTTWVMISGKYDEPDISVEVPGVGTVEADVEN